MKNYVRVMHPEEALLIQKSGLIPTNKEKWSNYEAGQVVFLLEADSVSWKTIRSLIEGILEKVDRAVVLSFRSNLPSAPDASGWGQNDAVVHGGTLSMSELINPEWRSYSVDT